MGLDLAAGIVRPAAGKALRQGDVVDERLVADLAEGMSNADIQYNIYKDMQRIQLEFFGEVM